MGQKARPRGRVPFVLAAGSKASAVLRLCVWLATLSLFSLPLSACATEGVPSYNGPTNQPLHHAATQTLGAVRAETAGGNLQ